MKFLLVKFESLELLNEKLLSSILADSEIRHWDDVREALPSTAQSPSDFIFLAEPNDKEVLFAALKSLRAEKGTMPIVVIAANESPDHGVGVLHAGADDCITAADITEKSLHRIIAHAVARAQARSELLNLNSEAQQAARSKSAFLANMSHEIRTPLNLIIGTADLLQTTSLSPQQKKLVSTFATAGDHLLTLLSNVLDLSQLDARGLHCVDAPFDIGGVFFEVCNITSVLCRAKRIKFDYLLEHDVPPICWADKVRIRQVLLNLLNNAVKFTDQGQIDLRLERLMQSDSEVILGITVSDTGVGMSEQNVAQAFQYFYQGDQGLERKYGGGGLGLSIVKAIVNHYHGEVHLYSSPGVGTTVLVTLKMAVETKSIEVFPPQPLQNERILVVSAAELEGQTICHQLQKLGAITEFIVSGEEAMRRLNSDKTISYALLDVQTTDVGGLQLLQRADFVFPRGRATILLPPLHRHRDIEDCLQLGLQGYLYKPFSPSKFLEMVGKAKAVVHPFVEVPAVHPLCILVVDDDHDNRELVAAYVAKTPHRVSYAKNGIEALDLAEQRRFDLVVMDIEMPGMNGYEVARRLKTFALCRETKILGLSANAFPHNIVQAKNAGFSGYLTKPIRMKTFLKSLTECYDSEIFYEIGLMNNVESA